MKLLGVPRPKNDTQSQELCSVEQLVQLLQGRRSVLRERILGDTETILHNGFVDTTNGCDMTARHAMDLVRKKHVTTIHKMEAAARRAEMQQVRDTRIQELIAVLSKQVRTDRMRLVRRLRGFRKPCLWLACAV